MDTVKMLAELFSKQNEGAGKEQREARLSALEQIASSVRARRSKSQEPHSNSPNPPKSRIHA
jgi:hypothetical protein